MENESEARVTSELSWFTDLSAAGDTSGAGRTRSEAPHEHQRPRRPPPKKASSGLHPPQQRPSPLHRFDDPPQEEPHQASLKPITVRASRPLATRSGTVSSPQLDVPQSPTAAASGSRKPTRYAMLSEQPLGSGGHGSVYSAFDNVTGKIVAIKRAHVDATELGSLEAEYRLAKELQHPHIVQVLDFGLDLTESFPSSPCLAKPPSSSYAADQPRRAEIIMEWMPCGSVSSIMRDQRFRLHETVVRRYAVDALAGLAFLHGAGVVHRDIKPANMLIDSNGALKLSDFGVSRISGQHSTRTATMVGTAAFLAPEVIVEGKYSAQSDIWAFGCAIVEMCSGAPPWSELPERKRGLVPLMFHIGSAAPPHHHPALPGHISADLSRVLRRCFSHAPGDRPSAIELLADEYFTFNRSDASASAEGLEDYLFAKQRHLREEAERDRGAPDPSASREVQTIEQKKIDARG